MSYEMQTKVACPLCGNGMTITDKDWYEEHNINVVELMCKECNLSINEYSCEHDGNRDYNLLAGALLVRVLK